MLYHIQRILRIRIIPIRKHLLEQITDVKGHKPINEHADQTVEGGVY